MTGNFSDKNQNLTLQLPLVLSIGCASSIFEAAIFKISQTIVASGDQVPTTVKLPKLLQVLSHSNVGHSAFKEFLAITFKSQLLIKFCSGGL